ncbi:MAG TPA: DUF5818 domain-containing protein [Candidatus Angelobacter sp.]|nr:DUF5818 domain-containing protein [Candidatus Angelobacter sp.]
MERTIHKLATGLSLAAAAALLATTMWAQDPAAQSPTQPGSDQAQSQPDTTKTFAGKVAKQGDMYVLKDAASKVTYVLQSSDELTQYVGKDVTVVGSLDASTNTIRVQKIRIPS